MASADAPDLEISSALQKAAGLLGADPAAAEALVRPVIAADPHNPDARLILGAALRARGAFDAALARLSTRFDPPTFVEIVLETLCGLAFLAILSLYVAGTAIHYFVKGDSDGRRDGRRHGQP